MSEEFINYEEQNQEEATQTTQPQPQPTVEKVSSNLVPGLVGAFLGSLIGAVLWVIIYNLGYIAGIAGAVTTVCAMKGYELFGKSLDKKGVICSVLVSIITIFLANRICWTLEIIKYLSIDVSFFDVFPYTEESLTDVGLGYYFKDLLIGYALTALASFKNIISAFKAAK